MRNLAAVLILVFMTSAPALAEPNEEGEKRLPVSLGGFVDTYYAFDFNNPQTHDRLYTSTPIFATQPARSNEFNVNLAYLDAKISAERVRGRIALQAGTAVQANYTSEPTLGYTSGPGLSRNIQEAVAGFRVTERLWIDGGIYFSHIGFESWISKDNWAYSRSMMADFSPYYQSGVKASYHISDAWSAQLHVLNGWQNISENNNGKALGLQLAYAPDDSFSFTYNNFFGDEAGTRPRFFNDFVAKYTLDPRLQLAAAFDLGLQRNSSGSGDDFWEAAAAYGKVALAQKVSLTLRAEIYLDKNQVIVTTGTPNGFQTFGASVNADVTLQKQLLWRTELRGFWSQDAVFPPSGSNTDGFVVTSLSLSI